MTNKIIIGAQSLTKQFGKCRALNGITFSIDKPCIVGLIGNNGAGKTTLLRLLNGLLTPTSGMAILNNSVPNDIEARSNCLLIEDTMSYPMHYRLKDILGDMPAYHEKWDADKANKLMEHFNLPFDRLYVKLSKGMRSIFNTIIGLSANVAVTMMDEPTSGMDVSARKDFYHIILNEFIANPRLFVISSHLIDEMENTLSHAIVLKNSDLVFSGDINELTLHGYRLLGNETDIAPLIENAQIFESSRVLGKTQYAVMCEYTDDDYEYMDTHGIERQQLSLSDICAYLSCSARPSNIEEIYHQ